MLVDALAWLFVDDDGDDDGEGLPALPEATAGTRRRTAACIARRPELRGAVVTTDGIVIPRSPHAAKLAIIATAALRTDGILDAGGELRAWCSGEWASPRTGALRQCSRLAVPYAVTGFAPGHAPPGVSSRVVLAYCRRCAAEDGAGLIAAARAELAR